MSYEDIVHNWGVLERYVIDTQFKNTSARNYYDLVKRVSDWLLLDETKKHLPEAIRPFIEQHENIGKDYLECRYIVPSSPLLRCTGIDEADKNYFSYYHVPTFDKFVELSSHALPGTEISYQPNLQDEVKEDLYDAISALSSPDISVTVREDGNVMDSFLRVSSDTVQRNFIFYHEVLDQINVARGICADKCLGLTFIQNFIQHNIISDNVMPFYVSSTPGYMGPNETVCPMFYINAAHIVATSTDYTQYLEKINHAAFLAVLMANIVLIQPDGYLDESFIEPTMKFRPIGVGIMGLHAAMIRCDVNYMSDVGLEFIDQTLSCLSLGAMTASAELMMLSSKSLRISHKADFLSNLLFKCESVLNTDINIIDYTVLKDSIRKHGCLYNLTTTVQGYDPFLADLLCVSTPGVEPLVSIEMSKKIHDEQSVILFPLEIFDNDHNMTCNLYELKEHTFPYITPKYKIKLLSHIQKFSHSPVGSTLIVPKNMEAIEVVDLIRTSVAYGLYHIKIRQGNHFLLENSDIKENEVEPEQVIEKERITDISDSEPLVLPSPFDRRHLSDSEMNKEKLQVNDSTSTIETQVSISNAKVYDLKLEEIWLRITITDDGKQVMIAPYSKSDDVKISILGSLNEFTISGTVDDGKVRF